MANSIINTKFQGEVSRILDKYKLAFDCPHCHGEINESHFSEREKVFQLIKEKVRNLVEWEVSFQKNIQEKQWLEKIENEKVYEKFSEVIKKNKTIEELTKTIKKFEEDLVEKRLEFEKELAKATSYDEIRKLEGFKELERKVDKYQKEIEELKEINQNLVISKSKDSQRKGEDFEKWFLEELLKVFDGRDNIKNISKGQIGIGKRADFLQEVLTDSEPKEIVGKIVYETKNTEKWDNGWVAKLENDMQTQGAEFGFIVATCANDKIIRLAESIDPRKKIYISDDNNNLFLVIKAIRELLIIKHNLMKIGNSTDKEQKLKKIEEWANDKLPKYILNLERQFKNQEKATETIINKAEKIKKFKDEIYKLTMNNIISELKEYIK